MQVFFVCGAPKSGTTWLQRVLDAHPEVICSGEGHFIQRFTIPLATVVREYNDYSRLVADRVYEGTPYYEPVDQQDFDRVARTFIMDRLIFRKPGPGVCWVGDKTPRYALHLRQLHRIFPECRFINIVRDPRDAIMSRLGHAARAGMVETATPDAPERMQIVRGGLRTGWPTWRRSPLSPPQIRNGCIACGTKTCTPIRRWRPGSCSTF